MVGDSPEPVIATDGHSARDIGQASSMTANSPLNKASASVSKGHKKSRRTIRSCSAVYSSGNDEIHGAMSISFGECGSDDKIEKQESPMDVTRSPTITRKRRMLKSSGPSCQSTVSTEVGSEVCTQSREPAATSPCPSPFRNHIFDLATCSDAKTRATVHAGAEHAKRKLHRKANSSTALVQKLKFATTDSVHTDSSGLGQKFRNGTSDQLETASSSLATQSRDTQNLVDHSSCGAQRHAVIAPALASDADARETNATQELDESPAAKNGASSKCSLPGTWKSALGRVRISKKVKKKEGHRHLIPSTSKSRKSMLSHSQAKPAFAKSSSLTPLSKSTRPANVPILPLASIQHEVSSDFDKEHESKTKNYSEADSASSSETSSEDEEEEHRPAYLKTRSEPRGLSAQGEAIGSSDSYGHLRSSQSWSTSKSLPSTGPRRSDQITRANSVDSICIVDASGKTVAEAAYGSSRLASDSEEQERRAQETQDFSQSGTSTEAEDSESSDGESEESEEECDENGIDKEPGSPDAIFPNEYRVEYKANAFARWTPAIVRHYHKGYYVLDIDPHVHHSRVRKIQDPLMTISHTSKDPRREMAAKVREIPAATIALNSPAAEPPAVRKSKASKFKSFVSAPYLAMRRYWCFSTARKPRETSIEGSTSSDMISEGERSFRWFTWKKKPETRQGLLDVA
mmetsp:Transcript_53591/g.83450  ORF Transcript_53591/g.83450 Transcript_53591/m.83450 type:complete len:688 (-) Transcript_53591:40-2103(-)